MPELKNLQKFRFKVFSCIADYKNRNKREKKENKRRYAFRVFTKPAGTKPCQPALCMPCYNCSFYNYRLALIHIHVSYSIIYLL